MVDKTSGIDVNRRGREHRIVEADMENPFGMDVREYRAPVGQPPANEIIWTTTAVVFSVTKYVTLTVAGYC